MSDQDTKDNEQPTFTIQPHPAKSNDPADLNRDNTSSGVLPQMQAHQAKGPYIPSQQILDNLEAPESREKLRARAAELNKK